MLPLKLATSIKLFRANHSCIYVTAMRIWNTTSLSSVQYDLDTKMKLISNIWILFCCVTATDLVSNNNNTLSNQLPSDAIRQIGLFLPARDLTDFSKTSNKIRKHVDPIFLDRIKQDYKSILNISDQLTANDIIKMFYWIRNPISFATLTQLPNALNPRIRGHLCTRNTFHRSHVCESNLPFLAFKVKMFPDNEIKTIVCVFESDGSIACKNLGHQSTVILSPEHMVKFINEHLIRMDNSDAIIIMIDKPWLLAMYSSIHYFFAFVSLVAALFMFCWHILPYVIFAVYFAFVFAVLFVAFAEICVGVKTGVSTVSGA
eukprot:156821_1